MKKQQLRNNDEETRTIWRGDWEVAFPASLTLPASLASSSGIHTHFRHVWAWLLIDCDPEWATVENAGLYDTVKIAPTNTNTGGKQKKVRKLMIAKGGGKE